MAALGMFIVSSIGGGGVAWGVSSTRAKDTRTKLDDHVEKDELFHTASIQRLTRLETKIDILLERPRANP